jgi:hypothetical protein
MSRFVQFAVALSLVLSSTLVFARQQPAIRVELLPPSPVTDMINLDIRGAVQNDDDVPHEYAVSLYLDRITPGTCVYSQTLSVPAHASSGVYYRRSTAGWAGTHTVILLATGSHVHVRTERKVVVLPASIRSTRTIGGAWAGIVHWSEEEGVHWNSDIRKLTASDWREQIRGMHRLGMDTVVIQEVFRNNAYYGTNSIAASGYHGLAYYPSTLFPGRIQMAAHDPIEAILSEADRLDMHVFLGVGIYAWFDFSPDSLAWHKMVAAELWRRYGKHRSFYGWYVSEEAYGSLIPDQGEPTAKLYRDEIISFFRQLQAFCRHMAPEKPILFAPNTHGLRKSQDMWPNVLKYIDIICPFGFHRMPKDDLSGEEAADLWQQLADSTGTHLWMDMEAFDFEGIALVPRSIDGLLRDMQRFPNFEKILCYQYPGIFNAPGTRIKPGGPATVRLYQDYRQYLLREGRLPEEQPQK